MNIPENLLYTVSHEWVELCGDVAKVGLTAHAAEQLGDIVFVDLPEEGDEVVAEENLGEVESVKAVSEVVSPVTGKVSAINEAVLDDPASVNQDPYAAWLCEISGVVGKRELLTPTEYAALLEKEA